MIDITAPKVLTPTLLFALLSPVFLFAVPPNASVSMHCNYTVHTQFLDHQVRV
jgi:hypothetical protein